MHSLCSKFNERSFKLVDDVVVAIAEVFEEFVLQSERKKKFVNKKFNATQERKNLCKLQQISIFHAYCKHFFWLF